VAGVVTATKLVRLAVVVVVVQVILGAVPLVVQLRVVILIPVGLGPLPQTTLVLVVGVLARVRLVGTQLDRLVVQAELD
jgi:hypothetical protein